MKKSKRRFRANSSGQLLIVAALAIAILISSTTIYVYELNEDTNTASCVLFNDLVLALKQGTKNTVMSSLANVSKGGDNTILAANLNTLSQVFRSLYHFGLYNLSFNVVKNENYSLGLCLSWTDNAIGVSSAYANFTLKVYHMETSIALDYDFNVTTATNLSGFYTLLESGEKLVNLTCQVSNEAEPALVESITLFYEDLGSWKLVNSSNNLSMIDHGNGTYILSFTVNTLSDEVLVSSHVNDLRDIFVQANVTCYEALT